MNEEGGIRELSEGIGNWEKVMKDDDDEERGKRKGKEWDGMEWDGKEGTSVVEIQARRDFSAKEGDWGWSSQHLRGGKMIAIRDKWIRNQQQQTKC